MPSQAELNFLIKARDQATPIINALGSTLQKTGAAGQAGAKGVSAISAEIEKATGEVGEIVQALNLAAKVMGATGQAGAASASEIKRFADVLAATAEGVSGAAQGTDALQDGLKGAGEAAKGAGDALKGAGDAAKGVGDAGKKAGDGLDDAGKKAKGAGKDIGSLKDIVNSVKATLVGVGAAITGAFAASAVVRAASHDFAEYEAGLQKLGRNTQQSGEDLKAFESRFQQLSQTLKGVSTEKMLEFGQVAGQLGIRGSADILKFTDTMAKLDAVFQTGESGAVQIGRLLLITGEGAGKVTEFANALAKTQLTTKATASELIGMTAALGQSTAGFKLGSTALLGLAAAATELNFEPQLFSSATGRVLRGLRDAAINGGQGMRDLGSALNLTQEDMQALIKTNPIEFFLKLADVVSDLKAAGRSTTGLFANLGVGGDEIEKVLGTIAENRDKVRKKVTDTGKAGATGAGTLDKLFEEQSKLLKVSMDDLSKSFNSLYVSIGAAVAPALKVIVDFASGALKALDNFIRFFPESFRTIAGAVALAIPIIIAFTGAVAAIGSVIGFIGPVVTAIGGLVAGFFSLAPVVGILQAVGAVILGVLGTVSAPVLAVVAAFAALAAGIYLYWGEIRNVLETMSPYAIIKAVGDKIASLDKDFAEAIGGIVRAIGEAWQTVKDVFNFNFGEAIEKAAVASYEGAKNAGMALANAVQTGITAAVNFDYTGWAKGVISRMGDAIKRDLAELDDLLSKPLLQSRATENQLELNLKLVPEIKPEDIQKSVTDAAKSTKGAGTNVAAIADLTPQQKAILSGIDEQFNALGRVKDQEEALKVLRKQSADQLQGLGLSTEYVARAEALVATARKRAQDPLFDTNRELDKQIQSAGATNKLQTERIEIEQKIAEEVLKNGKLSQDAIDGIRRRMEALNETTRAVSFAKMKEDLQDQIGIANALTGAVKERLQIEKELDDLRKNSGYNAQQIEELRQQKLALNQAQSLSSLREQYGGVAEANRKYADQVAILNKGLADGTIKADEYGRVLAALQRATLDQRDPIGAQVKSMKEAIELERIRGDYQEADRTTQQSINSFREKGVELSKAQVDAIREYNRALQDAKEKSSTGFEGFANSIPSIQKGLGDLQKSFASGLSDAITDALTGGKGGFTKLAQNIGKQMVKFGVDQTLKSAIQGSGLFEDGKAALDRASEAAKKLDGLKAVNTMTVQAGTVNVNGAGVAGGGAPGTPGAANDNTGSSTSSNPLGNLFGGGTGTQSPAQQVQTGGAAVQSVAPQVAEGVRTGLTDAAPKIAEATRALPQGTPSTGGMPATQSLPNFTAPSTPSGMSVSLNDRDVQMIARVVNTEISGSFKSGRGLTDQQGELQRQGVVDTLINRMGARGQTIDQVANAKNQFSGINGPAFYANGRATGSRGSVELTPDANPALMAKVREDIERRAMGQRADATGGGQQFLNPSVSDASALRQWGNYVVGQGRGYGYGSQKQFYGVGPNASPVNPAINLNGMGGQVAAGQQAMVQLDPKNTVAIGDSIAVGLGKAGGFKTGAEEGASSKLIADRLQSMTAEQKAFIANKDVLLSSGASNQRVGFEQDVQRQIDALKGAGAKGVTLEGVGTRPDMAGINDKLGEIARQNGEFVRFAGGIAKPGGDQVHPANYNEELARIREGAAKVELGPDSKAAIERIPEATKAVADAKSGGMDQAAIEKQIRDATAAKIDAQVGSPAMPAEVKLDPSTTDKINAAVGTPDAPRPVTLDEPSRAAIREVQSGAAGGFKDMNPEVKIDQGSLAQIGTQVQTGTQAAQSLQATVPGGDPGMAIQQAGDQFAAKVSGAGDQFASKAAEGGAAAANSNTAGSGGGSSDLTSSLGGLAGIGSKFAGGGMMSKLLGIIPSLVSQLSKLFSQLPNMLSGLFSGLGGAGAAGGGGGLFGGLGSLFGFLHGGGEVGKSHYSKIAPVNPIVFMNAKRYHTGLKNDEFPAILQRGERVLTNDQNDRMSRTMNGMAARMEASTANSNRGATSRTFNGTVVNNIYPRDADSFRRTEGQILSDSGVKMARIAGRNA